VFRATVLSIVLMLAAGSSATLVCSAWCHPDDATFTCQHEESTRSPGVNGAESCRIVPGGVTAFVREELRRTSPTSGADAFIVPGFPLAPPLTDGGRAGHASTLLRVADPPLLIVLRI